MALVMQLDRKYAQALTSGLTLALSVGVSAPALAWTPLAPVSESAINVLTADGKNCDRETGGGTSPSDIVGVTSIKSEIVSNYEGAAISSCLVYDNTTTQSTYGLVKYGSKDAGTNDLASKLWYRPVARNTDDVLEEGGALEYGKYTFNLDNTYSALGGKLKFLFLDTEGSWKTTGVTINDVFYAALTKQGSNDNIAELIVDMADIFTISLGSDTSGTGDGVNFQIFAEFNEPDETESIPEPSMLLGLVSLAGFMKSRRHDR